MNRSIWIVIALLAADPAHAQDEAKKGAKAAQTTQPRKKGAAEAKGTAKKTDDGGSSAWGTGEATKVPTARKKATTAAPKHAVERAGMLRLRSTYRYAVESCDRAGKTCDGALRDDSERRFMDGCLACATREQCEAERDLIRSGGSRSQTALCSD